MLVIARIHHHLLSHHDSHTNVHNAAHHPMLVGVGVVAIGAATLYGKMRQAAGR